MKPACMILSIVILVAILGVCLMVKYATEITVEERSREVRSFSNVYNYGKSVGVITLKEIQPHSERFPYVAAVLKNGTNSWSFACFASIFLSKWLVSSAHCWTPNSTYHVLIYHDYTQNLTKTHPITFWRVHEKYDPRAVSNKHDIAVAKINTESYSYGGKSSIIDVKGVRKVDIGVWKTVFSMDKITYLTNEMSYYKYDIKSSERCVDNYGIELDDSLICLDMSDYDDCFINEFGPVFSDHKLVGVLAGKPKDCISKIALFTNISYYTEWVVQSTQSAIKFL